MATWQFGLMPLTVLSSPAPARCGGFRYITFQPPGYNGISAVIRDGKLPVKVSVTVVALDYDEYETLSVLFESGIESDLLIPHGNDHWVYEDAFVAREVEWEKADPDTWTARVEFVCPNPAPTWQSTAEPVF